MERATSVYLKLIAMYINRRDSAETDFPWLVCWSFPPHDDKSTLLYNIGFRK